ncbi:Glycoside hydrolase, family 19, catalytic domain and Lysozyme-like domain-containing protein [Strongyloides ratti]|uniref:Glycoside hydrolase, family 19, catalytic domain and Lysozyme-like domain-containing protein n=1 Tax=Strongyloides ratti TaxID=34506 RepID=A0A090KXN7_STRRB|nr:Glycoside hydrolase, family 19, catalytic domain and Lysozyme-like domain-containing protein [Strongyloides ratti]CEF62255.1 Glycoside hydrolase, family 19, catalytic domain and Lysozyme-like domain-containing protein [Strongyloides ratti]
MVLIFLFRKNILSFFLWIFIFSLNIGHSLECLKTKPYATIPAQGCTEPIDPNNMPKSNLETWFTREIFNDLFPKANLGVGNHPCLPYSYESFVIAARYFPEFGNVKDNDTLNGEPSEYSGIINSKRDVAAFFAHAIQETGENDISFYIGKNLSDPIQKQKADDCFYRGGLYNWFEGGPTSSFLRPYSPGYMPTDGDICNKGGKYCTDTPELNYFYPCNEEKVDGLNYIQYFKGCYFGRGAIQISYNYNYGQFQKWLKTVNITVDLLKEPNLLMTKMDPPISIMASMWFYMTPQPPKPSMHDIVIGRWNAGDLNKKSNYSGAIFGPTSLIINNECNGEDKSEPGGPGESRRIKAFKWFCKYFNVPTGPEDTLSCKNMVQPFDRMQYGISYQPNWSQTWKEEPCQCSPASYGGIIPYFDERYYPKNFVDQNEYNRKLCIKSLYDNPIMYSMNNKTSACLGYPNPEADMV